MENALKKVLIVVILVFCAAVSIFLIAQKTSAQESYTATIRSLDEKVDTVLKLTATSTVASAGISAIPGDTATPIADKLADFTEYFLLILCVLYSEKYLLTIIGAGTFKILIPLACAAFGIGQFWNPKIMQQLGTKLLMFGLAIFLAIPLSIRVSDMIYDTYKVSIDSTISAAEEFTEETSQLSEATDAGLIASILSHLSETASSLSDKAADIMNRFIESLAIMIVTSCIIPVLVLLFFIWLIKILTGIVIPIPGNSRKHIKKAIELEA